MNPFSAKLALAVYVTFLLSGSAQAANQISDMRPAARPVPTGTIKVAAANARFRFWIRAFRAKAVANGISGKVYDRAFRNVRFNTYVIEKDRNQSEFTKQIWEYLDSATSETRVRNGKQAYARYRGVLKRIERKYGVDAKVVLAIWGLESAYGQHMGDIPVIESLATLAYEGRRRKFFEQQLIAALKILQAGDITPERMTGSWAGAMGHTQFMPTSYLAYAQDFRGDGKRDIWGNDPTDALASTANYLARHGWTKGQPWGLEVRLPRKFDFSLAGARVHKKVSEWRKLGIVTIDGKRLPDYGKASILLPAGSKGAAFIIFENFHVIETYNPADAYVIAVGHLGDRIMGGKPIQAKWPRGEKALSFKQKKQMQRLLRRKGFAMKKIDGIVGPNTIAAIRAYQASVGLTPDGYATTELLQRLRGY